MTGVQLHITRERVSNGGHDVYKHILIPTDGSDFSERAALYGVKLAKSLNARITALTVTPPWQAIAIGEVAVAIPEGDYETRSEKNAWSFLNKITDAAKAADVPCTATHIRNTSAYEAIIDAAQSHGCDLIVMGSHGRRGVVGFLLGSETVRVLTHSKLPVLVYRE
jgi:nucleotide-binding universal stress UspA family protein